MDVSVETRTLTLRLNMRRRNSGLSNCRKRGLMKQRAPWPEPQSSSLGLRVLMGQNLWNKVEPASLLVFDAVSESGSGAESGWGEALVCGSGGAAVLTLSAFSSSCS